MRVDTQELLELAVAAAEGAGALLVERSRQPARGVDAKTTATDLVSDADRDSESLILGLLERHRPDDGVLGEEGAGKDSGSGLTWIVDPLDGTVNFLYGLPWWAVSVAAADETGSVVGCVHNPVASETFTAVRGEGALLNGSPISVSDGTDLAKALIATGFAYSSRAREVQAEVVARVLPAARDVRRMGSAALDLCSVACGRVDGFYEAHLEEWDKAAGRLIVAEAGGIVTELAPPIPELSPGLIASNQHLHESLSRLIKE